MDEPAEGMHLGTEGAAPLVLPGQMEGGGGEQSPTPCCLAPIGVHHSTSGPTRAQKMLR